MKDRLQKLLEDSRGLASEAERRNAHIAMLRMLLQHSCLTLAEVILEKRRRSKRQDIGFQRLPLDSLYSPADGTLFSALLEMLVIAANENLSNFNRSLWLDSTQDRACWRLLQRTEKKNAERLISTLIVIRNDGVEGHGLPGENDIEAESDALVFVIDALSPVLPKMSTTKSRYEFLLPNNETYQLKTLRPFDGNIICYRSIRKGTPGICIFRVQIERDWFFKEETSYEAPDIFESQHMGESLKYEIRRSYHQEWSPLALIPDRLTADFTGREREIEELTEWTNDFGSRACMLYGDGGIGKTTLAVEFVWRLLEGTVKSEFKPELITFFTAKKTRWGIGGLEIIRLDEVGVADVAATIPKALDGGYLDKSWYSKPPLELIQALSGYLANDWGVPKESHLLILDNTETMASNDEEVRMLSRQILELSRRVGRVLLTSRRREALEAHQIEIKPLSDDESFSFLKARAAALERNPILNAAKSTLVRYSKALGNKPLVLEVFVQALGEHGIGLKQAFDRVMKMQAQDLGEFLYIDAWSRMSIPMRKLLLLMTRVSDVHDDTLLKLCCGSVGISVLEAHEALEESRGIAQLSKFDDHSQILFASEFLKFCAERSLAVGSEKFPSAETVEQIKGRYLDFLKHKSSLVTDRVEKAYRHPYARVAHTSYKEGRVDDCELFYELAVTADTGNGWLYERFAFFLSTKRSGRQNEALDWAMKATQLIPEDPDAWFTKGAIESRLGLTNDAKNSLERSSVFGKPRHLCLLQLAYAYANEKPENLTLADKALALAVAEAPTRDSLLWKFQSEVARLKTRLDRAAFLKEH
ncbi:hypothetical protein SB759_01430 [Pseudomonas sp. SIMBA_059]